MLPRADRLSALSTMLDHVGEQGWVLIADEAPNIADFNQRGYLFLRRN